MVNLALMIWAAAGFSGSCGGTTLNGRCVMAHSDTWYVECDIEGETAKITTPDNLVVVSSTSIDVDGRVRIPISPTITSVDVAVRGGTITVLADGVVLADCRTQVIAPACASPSGFVTALDDLNAAACAVIGRYSERTAELEKLCERYEERIAELEKLAAARSYPRSTRN